MSNKLILQQANAAIKKGDNEGFLSFCADDTTWNFVGERVLRGKEAVRQYMRDNYVEPPNFAVTNLISDGDYVIALGTIMLKDKDGVEIEHAYCDVWQFRDGKIIGLKAFVIRNLQVTKQ